MNDAATIRPLREEDTDDIIALCNRAATVDPGLGPVPRAVWQRFIKLPQNQGCRDFRVVERHGHLVGLAESSLKDQGERKVWSFKLVVHPAARWQLCPSQRKKLVRAVTDAVWDQAVLAMPDNPA